MIIKRKKKTPIIRTFDLTNPEKTERRVKRRNMEIKEKTISKNESLPNLKIEDIKLLNHKKHAIDFERKLQELEKVENFVSLSEMKLRAQDVNNFDIHLKKNKN